MKDPMDRPSPGLLIVLAAIVLVMLAIAPVLIARHAAYTNDWMAPAPQWRW